MSEAAAADWRYPRRDRDALVARFLRQGTAYVDRLQLARTLNLDSGGAFAVILAAPSCEAAGALALVMTGARAAPDIQCTAFAPSFGEAAGLLLSAGGDNPAALLRACIAALRAELAVQPPGLLAAASATTVGLCALPTALGQARYCLALLQARLVCGPFADWAIGGDLGPYRPLYPLWGVPTTGEFVREMLGHPRGRDDRRLADIARTVLAYARYGGHIGDAAAALGVHRNTVANRLRLIERRTGRSPGDPAHFLSLTLAALLWSLPAAPAPAD